MMMNSHVAIDALYFYEIFFVTCALRTVLLSEFKRRHKNTPWTLDT